MNFLQHAFSQLNHSFFQNLFSFYILEFYPKPSLLTLFFGREWNWCHFRFPNFHFQYVYFDFLFINNIYFHFGFFDGWLALTNCVRLSGGFSALAIVHTRPLHSHLPLSNKYRFDTNTRKTLARQIQILGHVLIELKQHSGT